MEHDDLKAGGDYAALCAVLKQEKRLLATFDRLPASDLRRAKLGYPLFKPLLEQRRYVDALTVVDVGRMFTNFERNAAFVPVMPSQDSKIILMVLNSHRRSTVTLTLDDIEVLAGAGDLDRARELAAKVIAFDSSRDTKDKINARLARAGHPDLLKPH